MDIIFSYKVALAPASTKSACVPDLPNGCWLPVSCQHAAQQCCQSTSGHQQRGRSVASSGVQAPVLLGERVPVHLCTCTARVDAGVVVQSAVRPACQRRPRGRIELHDEVHKAFAA
eukprot:2077-Chlamydomonas_euryale.AAC.5